MMTASRMTEVTPRNDSSVNGESTRGFESSDGYDSH